MQKSRFKLQLGPIFCKQLRRVITFVRIQWSALAAFAAVAFSRSSRGLKCTEDTAAAAEEGAEDAEAAAATGAPSIAEKEASKQTRHCLTRLQSHSRRERHIKGGTGRKVAHFTLLREKNFSRGLCGNNAGLRSARRSFFFWGLHFLIFLFPSFPPLAPLHFLLLRRLFRTYCLGKAEEEQEEERGGGGGGALWILRQQERGGGKSVVAGPATHRPTVRLPQALSIRRRSGRNRTELLFLFPL